MRQYRFLLTATALFLRRQQRRWRYCTTGLWSLLTLLLTACTGFGTEHTPSALDPKSFAAAQLNNLWWLMFWLGLFVFVVVLILTTVAVLRPRHRPADDERDTRAGLRLTFGGGVVFTLLILVIVHFSSMSVARSLSGTYGTPTDDAVLTIEVIGYQFWWEVRYPDDDFTTANEIRIPVGQPVNILLESADVIHSFWVPQLHGKIDLIPGMTRTIQIQADEPGVYRGLCAEFCGVQHTLMQFMVIAEPPDQFAAWLENQRLPAREPVTELEQRGQQVYLESSCVYCHAIRGVNDPPPTGVISPDLTHLASRLTLAAGAVENNPGNLGGWIVNPQGMKPGNRMPDTPLTGEELQALLAYLISLE